MKKMATVVIMLLTILISCLTVFAEEDIKILMVNRTNEFLDFQYLETDVAPFIENDSTLVPIRAIAESLNFNVAWNETDQVVLINNGNSNLVIKIGSTSVMANGQEDIMPIAAQIVNDRTFIPLRYVSEFFERSVYWQYEFDIHLIWISEVDLLTDEDVKINDNFEVISMEGGFGYFQLKPDGETMRGIKIGDTRSKVIEMYGEAHRILDFDGDVMYTYTNPALPPSEVSSLSFTFENEIVVKVALDGV